MSIAQAMCKAFDREKERNRNIHYWGSTIIKVTNNDILIMKRYAYDKNQQQITSFEVAFPIQLNGEPNVN